MSERSGRGEVTELLAAARRGDPGATERLFDVVYKELKIIAHAQRRRWHGNETLNTTALLNEAFIKLAGRDATWSNRTHFYATASRAMRQVLVNYAERQRAAKRGGEALRVPLDDRELAADATADELLEVHALLRRLEAENPRGSQVLEYRIFGGMSIDEVAEALGISASTVKREWKYTSAWLYRELQSDRPERDEGDGA